ncbi:putative receptor-type adenylate cyclase GRESAG 4 [Trypanosoma vivax]|nr:putative receptor-type adenylate cyclase GRESAG 4 [Trypanosoma vivax]
MQEVAQHQDRMNPRSLADYFYANIAVGVDDMHYGPFDGNKCITADNLRQSGCVVNYGATHIAVWSMARALDASVNETFPAKTPSMVYRSSVVLGPAIPTLVAITMTTLILILIFIGVLVTQCSKRSVRDNKNAPKNPTGPVTLIFTDIESSTAQWAAHPELMPDAVAAHHRLIRSLIVRHRCYEVKTIGDSFMIACGNAFTAVQLVRDLQQQFLAHQWGTTAFDESYREFEEQKAEREAEYVPPTARLEPEVYRQLWSGLRVRAGVHTGLCDIRHDEVTKGYDYYGGTSNMAARTESVAHGGQVLLTRAAYMALTADERARLDVTPLGAVPLRGVPEPVEMYQLNAVPGRTFAALRLDSDERDNGVDNSAVFSAGAESASSNTSLFSAAMEVAIHVLLSTFTSHHKKQILLSCCERWRVFPSKYRGRWDEDVYKDAVRRVASAAGQVLEVKAKNGKSLDSFGVLLSETPAHWDIFLQPLMSLSQLGSEQRAELDRPLSHSRTNCMSCPDSKNAANSPISRAGPTERATSDPPGFMENGSLATPPFLWPQTLTETGLE